MEEILASIRRIISDDDAAAAKPPPAAAKPTPVAVKPTPEPAAPAAAKNSQDDIDAMLASFDAVADDEPDEAPPAKAPTPTDVLELTEDMQAGAAANGASRSADAMFDKPPESERTRAPEAPRTVPDRALLSPRTTAAVDTAFNSLAHTVLMQNSRTLEDLVREMLKPMLKAWLDDNLPNMVERLVRAEIERVSRGRG